MGTTLLFQRYQGTVPTQVPAQEELAAVVERAARPSLSRLERCIEVHRAFQTAPPLTAILNRAVALAVQCCALVIREVTGMQPLLHFRRGLNALSEVIDEGIIDRIEQYRPVNATKVSLAHQFFTDFDKETRRVVGLVGGPSRTLAPCPATPSHFWKNEELRCFWERIGALDEKSQSIDSIALHLLGTADVEASLQNREIVMAKLSSMKLQQKGHVTPSEFDQFHSEVHKAGGLRAWIRELLPPDFNTTVSGASTLLTQRTLSTPIGSATKTSTWSSHALKARSASTGTKLPPGLGSRLHRKPFALTGSCSFRRRHLTGEDTSTAVYDCVDRGLLKESERALLADKMAVDARYAGNTALHTAAIKDGKQAPFSTMLLNYGADVHAEDQHFATPLHIAASTGHSEVTRRLLGHGADVHKADRWGVTPLHRASANGQTDVVQILMRGGASATEFDEWGVTPLHRAVGRGQLKVTEQLLGEGCADPNVEDRAGDRPLHLAARNGDYASVRLLLEHGGDARARSRVGGQTPEDVARARGHTDVVTLLQHRDEWITPISRTVAVA